MDDHSIEIDGALWGLRELKRRILRLCTDLQVEFEDNNLTFVGGPNPMLTGWPVRRDRWLWWLLKPGFITVHGYAVFVQPGFTGKRKTNVSILELEYLNVKMLAPPALYRFFYKLGAIDVNVVSHMENIGVRARWKAITCITSCTKTNPEPLYAFRIFFYGEAVANTVLRTYKRLLEPGGEGLSANKRSAVLKPVVSSDWDFVNNRLYRPTDKSRADVQSKRLMFFGLSAEVTERRLREALSTATFPEVAIDVRGAKRNLPP